MAILPQYHFIAKKIKKLLKPKHFHWNKKHFKLFGKNILWFSLGGILGLFFFISFLYIAYKNIHASKVYDGVFVDNNNFSGKDPRVIQDYFQQKNKILQQTTITLQSATVTATISAKQIDFGYDATLLADQAMTIGRSSNNTITNMSLMLQAYSNTINLPPAFHYTEAKLNKLLKPIKQQIDVQPVDPLFNFTDGKVNAFRVGTDGISLDESLLKNEIIAKLQNAALSNKKETIMITMPIKKLSAVVASNEADKLGIKEEVSVGTSLFHHSADERIFNISLAASRLNGIIIKPYEVFSFDKAVGDISSLSGYKQAYVIDNGKTILGDGGGVCQVSTTLFRAALNAGLPIIERHQHAYRVGYYEQDSGPGIDAAIYTPTVDLKFKNDTGHALLIQSYVDFNTQRLTFALYGTKDQNRQVNTSTPVVLSETPAPPPIYQDDATLPAGQIKQVDFAANGANVYFTRTVTENNKITIYDKFISNYKPWQAVYVRGTKT
ncbi:MAG TPA: VanW family protein [Candidatus Sulfotelmatobacter sp.]|jgi:vancomycin resistance protein YoaR|nr:VanW family protein [Candidatus Sulfotelmatobacter sp.]